jgi:hypothetical protein
VDERRPEASRVIFDPAAFALWIAETTGGAAPRFEVEPADEQILPAA